MSHASDACTGKMTLLLDAVLATSVTSNELVVRGTMVAARNLVDSAITGVVYVATNRATRSTAEIETP